MGLIFIKSLTIFQGRISFVELSNFSKCSIIPYAAGGKYLHNEMLDVSQIIIIIQLVPT